MAIFIDPRAYNGFRVHSHRDISWQDKHAEISELLGLEPWKPTPRKPRQFKPSRATFQLLGESNTISLEHGANDAMFAILVSDYRMAGHTGKGKVKCLVDFLGKSDADFERAWAKEPRKYTAQERAAAHGLPYVECRRLNLLMSGCADKSREERRRITLNEWNAKKRARRAEAKIRRERFRAALERVKVRVAVATVKVSSLRASILVTVLDTKTDHIEQESVNLMEKGVKKRRKRPEPMPETRQDSGHIPLGERIELMQRHCGLSREEAEAEARAWECA